MLHFTNNGRSRTGTLRGELPFFSPFSLSHTILFDQCKVPFYLQPQFPLCVYAHKTHFSNATWIVLYRSERERTRSKHRTNRNHNQSHKTRRSSALLFFKCNCISIIMRGEDIRNSAYRFQWLKKYESWKNGNGKLHVSHKWHMFHTHNGINHRMKENPEIFFLEIKMESQRRWMHFSWKMKEENEIRIANESFISEVVY